MRIFRLHKDVWPLNWVRRIWRLLGRLRTVEWYRKRRELGEQIDDYVESGRRASDAREIDLAVAQDDNGDTTDDGLGEPWTDWKIDRSFYLPGEAWSHVGFMLKAAVVIVISVFLLVLIKRVTASEARDLLVATAGLLVVVQRIIALCLRVERREAERRTHPRRRAD